ncbi:hypothetical protein RTBOTA2_006363 [Rhodotorula toruloides]|uniref:Uncharacterized protein n=1 Tax=Rhodotorula toruloides TaxID=5286 RepID=A0A0K3CTY2_RHOTO|nr:hypothetical protein RTBOTA2_006363 [Rhodotorula toruloides]PRQ70723.1 hypothetical protein AAT19DRAFT_10880 [Rhodotorula toruloides]
MSRFSNGATREDKVGLRSFLGADSPILGSRRPSAAPIQARNDGPSQCRSSSHSRSFSSSLAGLFLPRRSSDSGPSSSSPASPTSSFGSTSSSVQVRPLSFPAPGRSASTAVQTSTRRGVSSLTKFKSSTAVSAASSRISWPLERDCEAAAVWVSGYREDGGADDRSRARKLEARVDCRCRDCGTGDRRRVSVM